MNYNLVLLYIVFFISASFLSLIINCLLLKFAKTLGIRRNGNNEIIRWSENEKPSMGGISFYILFLLTIIVFNFLNIYNIDFLNIQTMGLFIAITIGFLLGLFDDAYNTRPWLKFFTQVLCGVILILTGTSIELFNNELLNYFLTIFWVVGIMNSINMLDNMDGITAIVSIFILCTILAGIFLKGDLSDPLIILMVGTLGTLTGFLFFNWNPAKIFMGDTGSQFLGVLLAGIGIIFFWNGADISGNHITSMKIVAVGIAFLLPIVDTTTVFIKRIAQGTSPFIGGKDHTTHHLSYLGLSERQVAWLFIFLSLISLLFTIIITNYIEKWNIFHIIGFSLYAFIVFTVLFIIAYKKPPKTTLK